MNEESTHGCLYAGKSSFVSLYRLQFPVATVRGLHLAKQPSINISLCRMGVDRASVHVFANGRALSISRNGPYIGGHLAFYFKLNFKQVYNVL